MNSSFLTIALFSAAFVVGAAEGVNLFKVKGDLSIGPHNERALYSSHGIIHGLRQCGGPGRAVQWRQDNCDSNRLEPCVLHPDEFFRGEFTFTPSDNTGPLGIINNLRDTLTGATLVTIRKPNMVDNTEPGKMYSLTGELATTQEMGSRYFTTQVIIYRENNQSVEVCAEVDFLNIL